MKYAQQHRHLKYKKGENRMSKTKSCKTCKYRDGPEFDGPYRGCSAQLGFNHWKEKEEDT